MKKVITVTMIFTLAICIICGCASEPADKAFSKAGLTITLNSNFKDETGIIEGAEQYSFIYISERDKAGVLALKEDFETFDSAGVSTDISLEEFAQLVIDTNGYNTYVEESSGLTHFTYSFGDFRYFSVMYRGAEAYWIVQFYAESGDFDGLMDNFIKWANTVSF